MPEGLASDVLQVEDVQRLTLAGGEDPGPQHAGARGGDGAGEVGEQTRPVGGGDHQLGGVQVLAHIAHGRGALGQGPLGDGGVDGDLVLAEAGEIGVLHGLGPGRGGGIGLHETGADLSGREGLALTHHRDRIAGPTAPEDRRGRGVEVAQQLALPAVPDPRPHGADIGHGQHQQQAQTFGRLHQPHEVGHGARVGDVALLGVVAHLQVMLHQPGDQIDARPGQAQPLAGRPGGPGAGLFLAAGHPALAGVVQQHGQEENVALLDLGHQGDGQRVVLGQTSGGDVGDDPHRPQGVLVHRVGVVHVELHLGDDASELRKIAAQHAGLGHQGQRPLRIAAAGQDVEEDLGRLGVAPHLGRDHGQRPGGGGEGVRVKIKVALVGDLEEPQQVQRIGLEDLGPVDAQTPALLVEAGHVQGLAVGLAPPARQQA